MDPRGRRRKMKQFRTIGSIVCQVASILLVSAAAVHPGTANGNKGDPREQRRVPPLPGYTLAEAPLKTYVVSMATHRNSSCTFGNWSMIGPTDLQSRAVLTDGKLDLKANYLIQGGVRRRWRTYGVRLWPERLAGWLWEDHDGVDPIRRSMPELNDRAPSVVFAHRRVEPPKNNRSVCSFTFPPDLAVSG